MSSPVAGGPGTPRQGCPVCPGPHGPDPVPDPVPGPATRTSVVICHYEQPRELARTLACLARQTRPPDQVVVTDDGSASPPRVPPGVRVVRQPDRGFRAARARNLGAAATDGDLLVFLDADTSPEPDCLERLTAPLRTDPDLLVVGRRRHTRLTGLDPADPLHGATDAELPEPAWLTRGWRESDDLREADDTSYRFVISAVLACARPWFDRVGGFDPTFTSYGGEDWDLAHRWWVSGGRLRHVPGAVAWHDGPDAGAAPRTWSGSWSGTWSGTWSGNCSGTWSGTGTAAAGDSDAATDETLEIARRISAPVAGFTGLRVAPPRVVVTHDPGLSAREVVIGVDGVLRDLPRATVVSNHPVWGRLPDERVVGSDDGRSARARWALRLHRGVAARAGAWSSLPALAADAVHTVLSHGAVPMATLTDLRALRRSHLGLAPLTSAGVTAPDDLLPADGVTLAAWLGGWW